MTPVQIEAQLEARHFEIEVDEEVVTLLRQRATSQKISASMLANDLLRKELVVH